MNIKRSFAVSAILALLTSTTAYAGKSDDVARIALAGEVGTLNYYFDSSREGFITSLQIFNGLVYKDPKTAEFKGDLAESWKQVDDKTYEFTLRKNVKFSNGEPFTADDVVFTINYVIDPATKAVVYDKIKWIKSAEKIDDYTVRVNATKPYPMAMENFSASLPIYPKDYYEKVGQAGMATKPVGTGPYMVTSVTPGSGYSLEKNPNSYAGPKATPAISKVEVRTIRDVNTQLAELISGNLDFMWQFPADIAEKLAGTGQFNVFRKDTMRIGFITLDAAGRSSPDGPLKNLKVRQALNYAIDRKGIVAGLLPGGSVINSACAPIQFGCETDVTAYDYNPEKAKELLKEAGYEKGFSIDIGAYRDKPAAEAMINNLAAVGVKATLSTLQYSALAAKHMEGNIQAGFLTHGASSIADVAAVSPEFFAGGKQDYAGDKEVIALMNEGGSTMDREARKAAYSKAFKRIADQAYWVPLWTYPSTYALSQDLKFDATSDELIRFYDMGWN